MRRFLIALILSMLPCLAVVERQQATQPVSRRSADERVAQLISALADPNLRRHAQSRAFFRTPATVALGELRQMGPTAVPGLAAALNDSNVDIRANVAWILGSIETPEAAAALVKATTDDAAIVRQMASYGLERHNSPESVKALLPLLQDSDAEVRTAAARALGSAAVQTSPGVPIPNELRNQVVRALGEAMGEENVTALSAADALGTLEGANALPALIDFLETAPNELARSVAVRSLGKIKDRRATVALIEVLNDEHDPSTVSTTAQALGSLADVRATEPLIRLLTHENSNARFNAAESLGMIGDWRATPHLVRALSDADERVRDSAARALGSIGNPAAVEPLIAALQDRSAARGAAEALGKIGDPRAIEPLVRVLFDNQRAGESAVTALSEIRHPDVVRLLAERTLEPGVGSHAAFVARRTVGKLTGADNSFDAEGFRAWWLENALYYRPTAEDYP